MGKAPGASLPGTSKPPKRCLANLLLAAQFTTDELAALQSPGAPCPLLISNDICNASTLFSSFRACEVVFTPLSANSLAHDLTCWAASLYFEGLVYAGFDPLDGVALYFRFSIKVPCYAQKKKRGG